MKGIIGIVNSNFLYATALLLIVVSSNAYSMDMAVKFLGNIPETGAETLVLESGAKLISIPAPQSRTYELILQGEIEPGDFDDLLEIIETYSSFPNRVIITSPGGDVLEAIKMGRLFSEGLVDTSISTECNSSCFLLWVGGGSSRLVEFNKLDDAFKVGLHRPRYDPSYFSSLSIEEAKVKYAEVENLVLAYLEEMDVPQSLTEKMMATSSADILWIDAYKLSHEIGLAPHVYNEWEQAKCGDLELSEPEKLDYAFKDSRSLSKGYLEYLNNKFNEYVGCVNREIRQVQIELIKEMFPESASN